MTRTLACAALALVAAGAAAQPPKPPGVVPLKQFGGPPEQFFQSSVARWTGQLTLELQAARADVARANVSPFARAGLLQKFDRTLEECADLERAVRRGAPRAQVGAAFGELDKDFAGLAAAVAQHAQAAQAARAALGRADVAYHQLAAALAAPDDGPERQKRRLQRLADALDDGADELRELLDDQLAGAARPAERAAGAYGREVRQFGRRVRDGFPPDELARAFAAAGQRWADAIAALVRVRQLPPAVFAQAQKLDGLHRRLAAVLNQPPFPGGANPLLPVPRRVAFAVGADAGAQPRVTVFGDERGTPVHNFFAYDPKFDGGVRVDMADLNGDGVPELVTAPGAGRGPGQAPPVRVFDGRDMSLLVEFTPFAPYNGGLQVAAQDLARDGRALVAVAADANGHVKVFDLAQGKEADAFFAHDPKRVAGGARLAWGDVNGDGTADLLTVTGPANAPTTVRVFSGRDRAVLAEFPAVDAKFRGGAFVAAADLAGTGRANPVVALDAGGPPLVRVFDERGKALVDLLAYDPEVRSGVRVAVSDRNRLVVAPGFGVRNSPVRVFDPTKPKAPLGEFAPFPGFDSGLFVGGR